MQIPSVRWSTEQATICKNHWEREVFGPLYSRAANIWKLDSY